LYEIDENLVNKAKKRVYTKALIGAFWLKTFPAISSPEIRISMDLNSFIIKLESWDIKLFLLLNGKHTPSFDAIMYLLSDIYAWVPLYLGCLYLIGRKYNLKIAAVSLLFIALVILLCDRLSVIAFKDVVRRYRPCHNLAISHLVYTLNGYCGVLYGFVSSHAANSFGLALFSGNMLKKEYKWLFILILFWASAVAYSRVYLGVHYPADIIGGAILGGVCGWLVFRLFIIFKNYFYKSKTKVAY
jgi:undecaprenyl-diphosphatase